MQSNPSACSGSLNFNRPACIPCSIVEHIQKGLQQLVAVGSNYQRSSRICSTQYEIPFNQQRVDPLYRILQQLLQTDLCGPVNILFTIQLSQQRHLCNQIPQAAGLTEDNIQSFHNRFAFKYAIPNPFRITRDGHQRRL
ncbi:hypothetical protein D3C73_1275260 [compost metagenome]